MAKQNVIQININVQKCPFPGFLSIAAATATARAARGDGTCEVLFAFGITLCSVSHRRRPSRRPRPRPPDTHKMICHETSAPIKFPFRMAWAPFDETTPNHGHATASVTDPRRDATRVQTSKPLLQTHLGLGYISIPILAQARSSSRRGRM